MHEYFYLETSKQSLQCTFVRRKSMIKKATDHSGVLSRLCPMDPPMLHPNIEVKNKSHGAESFSYNPALLGIFEGRFIREFRCADASFFKENVRYPKWTCRDPISLIIATRFSLILGTRCSRHFMVCTCMTHNSHLLRINNAEQLTLILRELLFAANQEHK